MTKFTRSKKDQFQIDKVYIRRVLDQLDQLAQPKIVKVLPSQ